MGHLVDATWPEGRPPDPLTGAVPPPPFRGRVVHKETSAAGRAADQLEHAARMRVVAEERSSQVDWPTYRELEAAGRRFMAEAQLLSQGLGEARARRAHLRLRIDQVTASTRSNPSIGESVVIAERIELEDLEAAIARDEASLEALSDEGRSTSTLYENCRRHLQGLGLLGEPMDRLNRLSRPPEE